MATGRPYKSCVLNGRVRRSVGRGGRVGKIVKYGGMIQRSLVRQEINKLGYEQALSKHVGPQLLYGLPVAVLAISWVFLVYFLARFVIVCLLCPGGVLNRNLGRGVRQTLRNPYPVEDTKDVNFATLSKKCCKFFCSRVDRAGRRSKH